MLHRSVRGSHQRPPWARKVDPLSGKTHPIDHAEAVERVREAERVASEKRRVHEEFLLGLSSAPPSTGRRVTGDKQFIQFE